MFARVSTYEGDPARIDESIAYAREHLVPAAEGLAGFRGVLALADRRTGKSVTLTLWESEEAMRASEAAADRLRKQGAEVGGEEIVAVERYEVVLDSRSG